MNCNLCNKSLDSNTIKYKCGHVFHKSCLLPKIMSIINPECKICNNGKIDGYPSNEDEEEVDEDEEEVDKDEEEVDKDEEEVDKDEEEVDEVDKDEDEDEEEVDKDEEEDDDDLTRHEKIILCEFVLFGLSLVGLIIGIICQ
jgi:nucleosome binding factor SPN SPT16 subunit